MSMQQINEQALEIENQWKGTKVYIIGDHPHAGEVGTVEAFDFLGTISKWAFRIKGQSDSFFVYNTNNLQLLKK